MLQSDWVTRNGTNSLKIDPEISKNYSISHILDILCGKAPVPQAGFFQNPLQHQQEPFYGESLSLPPPPPSSVSIFSTPYEATSFSGTTPRTKSILNTKIINCDSSGSDESSDDEDDQDENESRTSNVDQGLLFLSNKHQQTPLSDNIQNVLHLNDQPGNSPGSIAESTRPGVSQTSPLSPLNLTTKPAPTSACNFIAVQPVPDASFPPTPACNSETSSLFFGGFKNFEDTTCFTLRGSKRKIFASELFGIKRPNINDQEVIPAKKTSSRRQRKARSGNPDDFFKSVLSGTSDACNVGTNNVPVSNSEVSHKDETTAFENPTVPVENLSLDPISSLSPFRSEGLSIIRSNYNFVTFDSQPQYNY